MFSRQSCVVFISLMEPLGTIKHVQNSFERIFGFKTNEIIGKSINTIIPDIIS